MFCTKCGAEIAAGSKFCTRCGTPVVSANAQTGVEKSPAASAPTVSAVPHAAAAPEASASAPVVPSPETHAGKKAAAHKLDTKKLLVPGAIVLAIIIAIILVLNLNGSHSGFGSPEEAFDAYLGGYASGDFDLMLKAYPDFRIEKSGGEDSLKEIIAENYEYEFGESADSYQFVYKATGHTILSEEDRQSVENDINATFETDVKITDVAEVDYDLTVRNKADGTEQNNSYTGGYAVKYKGKWYYFNVFG